MHIPVDSLAQVETLGDQLAAIILKLTWRLLEAMAAGGAQLEVLSTNMEHLGQLLKQILQKDSFMEVRSNYAGHDGEKVLKREVVEELARCLAVKMQKTHEHSVKMTMLKRVLKSAAQLEFALKTWKITDGDIKAALERMELVYKLELTNTNRIGMEKPGDLCQLLKSCSWVYIYIHIYIL